MGNISDLDKNDWDHFHDCIFNTTKVSLEEEDLKGVFDLLPDDLKDEAYEWGMSDTLWRDNFYDWYKENAEKFGGNV